MKQLWLTTQEGVGDELRQALQEGKEPDARLVARIRELAAAEPCAKAEREAREICLQLEALPVAQGFAYTEPSELSAILALRPANASVLPDVDENALMDRIHGAWLGRACGCVLGMPVECWKRERITGLLKDTGNFPIRRYMSSAIDPSIRENTM